MMKLIPLAGLAALVPTVLQAHETAVPSHMHPHGSETILAAVLGVFALAAVAYLWGKDRS